jgi:hypothetical protein
MREQQQIYAVLSPERYLDGVSSLSPLLEEEARDMFSHQIKYGSIGPLTQPQKRLLEKVITVYTVHRKGKG